VSREISRNGGYDGYRAALADDKAWARARRPKRCKFATSPWLRQAVASKLRLNWAPEQIAGWLKRVHPEDERYHVSHETIYRSLFVQARGVLKKELLCHLRSKHTIRRSKQAGLNGDPSRIECSVLGRAFRQVSPIELSASSTAAAALSGATPSGGDGLLIEFASAVDAARCAIESHRSMAQQSTAVPHDKRIEFRIAIHLGDIISEDNDIFGYGVNIAARLEGIAEPGGVCIFDDAEQLAELPPARTHRLPTRTELAGNALYQSG